MRYKAFTLVCTPCFEKSDYDYDKTQTQVKDPCIDMLPRLRKACFTLVEVLIVIAVIGVVAAITIPALLTHINDRIINPNRKEVIEDRLIQGLNQLNTIDGGMDASQYENTEQFVRALSRHYKMSQICGAEDMRNCFPYDTIKYTDPKNNEASANVDELKTPEAFQLKSSQWLAPASFISSGGTPFVMLLNKNCIMDTGEAMREIPVNCISYMYDNNGSNSPNKIGKDLEHSGINLAPKAILGGVKIMTDVFIGTGLTESECQAEMDKADEYKAINSELYIKTCQDLSSDGGDRWAYAMKYCKDLGYHLPTEEQLADIANALYTGMNASSTDSMGTYQYGIDNALIGSKEPVPATLKDLGSSWYDLWSGREYTSSYAYYRRFLSTSSFRSVHFRYRSYAWAVCVKD